MCQSSVFVFEIKEEIGPEASRYVSLALEEAKKGNYPFLILELDTYGGALDAAEQIRTKIIDYPKPIYVFINKNAASAGALISIACDSIYMSAGSNIGSATVVNENGQPLPDKYQSYMRALMRSTAQVNKRDEQKAERMVGVLMGKDSSTISNVLAYSTKEAIANQFCEAQINSIEELLLRNGLSNAKVVKFELSATEKIIRFFLSPYLRGILILIMIAGIYYEMSAPGIGFALVASILAALLYFVPSYLNGLAENWEIIMFLIGLILIVLEIFVIPGFGVVGVAGMALVISALVLVMINNHALDFTYVNKTSLTTAIAIALFSSLVAGVGILFFGERLFSRLALKQSIDSSDGYTANFLKSDMLGKKGIAHTVMRPSGKVKIDGEIYDAYSTGEFIEAGVEVIVLDHLATQLKVKRIE
ncbi:MAG: nodulation protein NfeD [Cytophagales bacterium]|nr:MAG: nodulation protein NfeD [Cytophagales bacterium]